MRPNVDFRPKVPVNPAGMRMEPPPSPAVPRGRMPPATAAAVVPGVARRAVEAGVGVVDAAELAGRGLGREDGTGTGQTRDHRRAARGHPVGEDERRLGVGPSLDDVELLHPDRDATEGKGDVGPGGDGTGVVGGDMAEGVELRPFDSGQCMLQCLGRGDLTLSEGVDEGTGVALPRLVGHWRRLRHRVPRRGGASA
jgi:hypothetical protein